MGQRRIYECSIQCRQVCGSKKSTVVLIGTWPGLGETIWQDSTRISSELCRMSVTAYKEAERRYLVSADKTAG